MLRIEAQWLEAPGVRGQALAKTWASLRISIEDRGQRRSLTHLLDHRARSERDEVFGSALPLAEWLVENWWFLLHEPIRSRDIQSSRELVTDPAHRNWVRRHSLLSAREGGSLPDVQIFRERESVRICWFPDPFPGEDSSVTFLGQGDLTIDLQKLELGISEFVDQVLDRLGDCDEPDVASLKSEWDAIHASRRTEAEFCAAAATMGVDPYDDEELTPQTEESLHDALRDLKGPLIRDLLEATTARDLSPDTVWVRTTNESISSNGTSVHHGYPQLPVSSDVAHRAGYELARRLRGEWSLNDPSAVADLVDPGGQRVHLLEASTLPSKHFDALAAPSQKAIAVRDGSQESQRFRVARAWYFLVAANSAQPIRLVSAAQSWDQRASRAFAAELLAPAQWLRHEVGTNVVDGDDVRRLAKLLRVSDVIVQRQLQNHQIADVRES